MAAIDFPNAPLVNDEFEINGTIYYWTGSVWEIKFFPSASLSNDLPQNNGTASAGTSNLASRSDHIHSTDTSRASATDLSTHISATTSVHGIADTANLVLTNDSRLTDARSPTTHASSHGSAGSDPITIAQSQVTNLTTDLGGKEPAIVSGTTEQYWRGDKSWQTLNKSAVGLSNVENTALSTWSGSTNITSLGTISAGTWQGSTISSTYIDSSIARLASPTFTGVVTVPTPVNSTDAATKAYVDEVAEGLKTRPSVEIATTANLSATYSNGTSGVGATLTADSNGAFPEIDGVTLSSTTPGQNGVLVKNQSNPAHNGRYNLTQVGDESNPWILTRCGLCDQASEIPGSYAFVKRGTINTGTGWVQIVSNPSTFVVGTDAITVTQFTGGETYTAGTGLQLIGNQFSNTGVLSITGTANEIDVSASTGSITLSLPATISADINGNAATVTNGVYTTGSYSDPSWLTISKSKVGLSNVENTALSTWTGSSNITTVGTIGSGTWNGSTISATYIDSAIARLVSPSFTTPNIGVASSTSLTIDSSVLIDTSTTTINTNSSTTINSISASTYRSAEYLVQVTQGTKYTVSKLIMTHNDSIVTITEYAVIELGESRIPLTISGELESGNIVIKATITDASTTNATAKVVKTAIVL